MKHYPVNFKIMQFTCAYCGKEGEKYVGHINRANKLGLKLYCNFTCMGLAHRKTIEEKKRTKAVYDKRILQTPERKQKKHEYFMKAYAANPEKYKNIRKERYQYHLQYLQTPEYKSWKKDYDEKHLANKHYGEFAEAAIALKRIEEELDSQAIKIANGITFNKSSQQRKRKWQQLSKVLLSKF